MLVPLQFAGYRAAMAGFAMWQDRFGDSQVYFDGSNYGKQGRICLLKLRNHVTTVMSLFQADMWLP